MKMKIVVDQQKGCNAFNRVMFFVFLLFCGLNANAQLENTNWLGELKMPLPMECYYSFGTDTARLSMIETNENFEVMFYRTEKDTLFLKKISGISPCSTQLEGMYLFEIVGETLHLRPYNDECKDRAFAFSDHLSKIEGKLHGAPKSESSQGESGCD